MFDLNVPVLNSLPGAPVMVHLDFNGTPAFVFQNDPQIWASGPLPGDSDPIPAFSIDGDLLNYSDPELTAIRQIWEQVSEKYSPFNINVTTVAPTDYPDGVAVHAIIGGSDMDWYNQGATGVAPLNAFTGPRPNSAFTFSADLITAGSATLSDVERHKIAEIVAHEVGHTLGLEHQSEVDPLNNVLVEYSNGTSNAAPIMGSSSSNPSKRGVWWWGPATQKPEGQPPVYVGIQDDLATITRPGNFISFRADDFGSFGGSGSLVVNGGDGTVTASGVLETNGDRDAFLFSAVGSILNFTVNNAPFGGMLSPSLELIPLSGSAGGTVTLTHTNTSATLKATGITPGGGYLLQVKPQYVNAGGQYDSLGKYSVTGSIGAFAGLASGVLTVNGFDTDNDLSISYIANTDMIVLQDDVFGGAAVMQFPRSEVSSIYVNFGTTFNNDTISVLGQFSSLSIPITIDGKADRIEVGGTSLDDYFSFDTNFLRVNNTPISLTASSYFTEIRFSGLDGADVFDVTSTAFDDIVLLGNAGNDTFNVGTAFSTFGGIRTSIFAYGDLGSDTLNLGSGTADVIRSDIRFDGGSGGAYVDEVNYNDGAMTGTVEYTVDYDIFSVSPSTVVRAGFVYSWTLDYQNVDDINIYAGGGNDHFIVDSSVIESVACYGNAGNDTFSFGDGSLAPIAGQVFNGGLGNDTLEFDDHQNVAARDWDVIADRVTYASAVVFITAGFEGVRILAGGGSDNITVSGNLTQTVAVDAGGGSDTIFANAAKGSLLSLSGGGGPGTDVLIVDDRNTLFNATNFDLTPTLYNRLASNYPNPDIEYQVQYGGFEAFTAWLPNHQNVIRVYGTSPDISVGHRTDIQGGNIDDYFEVYPHDSQGNLTIVSDLQVNGLGGPDAVYIQDTGSTYPIDYVMAGGIISGMGSGSVYVANSESLVFYSGEGNDSWTNVPGPLANAPTTIYAAGGNDTITYNATLTPSTVSLDGGTGTDTLHITDAQSTAPQTSWTITAGSVIRRRDDTGLTRTYSHAQVESTVVSGTNGVDVFGVRTLAENTQLVLNAGGGLDGLTVFDPVTGTVDGIRGSVAFHGQSEGGNILLDDSFDTDGDVVHLTANSVGALAGDTFFGLGGSLTFSNLVNFGVYPGLTLQTGLGADTIYAQPLGTARVDIYANEPAVSLGDTLRLALAAAQNPILSGTSAGNVTSSNLQTLSWTGIEEPLVVDDTAPQVLNSSYDESAGSQITFQFSEDVSQTLNPGSLVLINTSTGQQIAASVVSVNYIPATNIAHFSFAALPGGLLPSGNYIATLASTVTDAFGNSLQASVPLQFSVVRTIAWVGAGDGMWNDPANWAGGQIPQANDFVEINDPNVHVTITVPAGTYAVARLVSHESLVIAAGATFAVGGPVEFHNATITNFGLFDVGAVTTPTKLLLLDGATFVNTSTGTLGGWGNPFPGGFNIGGSGSGSFINNGQLFVHTGTFGLAVAGSSTGTFDVAGGAAISFSSGYTFDQGTHFGGGGLVQLATSVMPIKFIGDTTLTGVSVENSGLVEFLPVNGVGAIAFDGIDWHNLPGGSMGIPGFPPSFQFGFGGGGQFINDGLLYVHSGSFGLAVGGSSTGTFEVADGAALSFSGGFHFRTGTTFDGGSNGGGQVEFAVQNDCPFVEYVSVIGVLLRNLCVVEMSPAGGGFQMGGGATFFNEAGGTLLIPASASLWSIGGEGAFMNNGLVDVQGGTVQVGAGTSTGTFQVAAGATLQFVGGFDWNDGTSIVSSGTVLVQPLVPPNPTVPPNPIQVTGQVSVTSLNVGVFGALDVIGNLSVPSGINISAAGILSGTGAISGNVVTAGLTLPGSSPGLLTIDGDFTQSAGGVLRVELAGNSAGLYDQLIVRGTVTLGGTLEIAFSGGFVSSPGSQFVLVENDGNDAIADTFSGLLDGSLIVHSSRRFHVSYTGGSGNDVQLTDVTAAALIPDDIFPGTMTLLVLGSTASDVIEIKPGTAKDSVRVFVNGVLQGTFQPTGRILVRAGSGHDTVKVADGPRLPVWVYGEAGNDSIWGGSGTNVLLGGHGDDSITGGSGRDVLIGGLGADRIVGAGGDDLLIAGSTIFDSNELALKGIVAEWTSSRTYEQRIANLTGTGSGSSFASRLNGNYFLIADGPQATVLDDGARDKLTGSSGRDWYLGNWDFYGQDLITDKNANEWDLDLD